MPFTPVALSFPPDASGVVAGDVDADGRDELIVVASPRVKGQPDRIVLTVQHLGADGSAGARTTVDLGNRPTLWDADHGLWGLDRDGLVRLDPAGGPPVRIARFPTMLTGLGPATPQHADLARDLDDDGIPELVAWSGGRYLAFRTDGTALGSIPAPARGSVRAGFRLGGEAVSAANEPPPLAFGDVDGDRKVDLLLPSHDTVQVYYTGALLGARAGTIRIPLDLEPEPPPPGSDTVRREISGVWLEDLDGDRKVDLGVSRYVHDGSWFSATVEWLWARGTGNGFEAIQTTSFSQAAFNLEPADVDGDGDQDLTAIVADVTIGNIARALVARQARGDLVIVPYAGGYAEKPVALRALTFPIENFDDFHVSFEGDLDGDKKLDLVCDDGSGTLRAWKGTGTSLPSAVTWDSGLTVPPGSDLFIHDLTGDGRAEVVVWARGRTAATLLRTR